MSEQPLDVQHSEKQQREALDKTEMTLKEYLKGRKCKGFSPVPHYNPYDDSMSVYFVDDRAYAVQLSPDLTVYFSMDKGYIVGCKIAGIQEMIRKDQIARCQHEWVEAEWCERGGRVCAKCGAEKEEPRRGD